eukprot:g1639.t1
MSTTSSTLRQLSSERGVPVPRLKRELSNEGLKLVREALLLPPAEAPRSSSGAAGVGGRARVTQGRTISVGDHVLAPYGGDYYLAELVRVDSNGERGRVLFLDYDEYATVAMSELLEADETTVAGSAPYEAHGDSIVASYDDDFSPMTERVGGGGGGGSSIYSQKHIRAKERLLSAAPKPIRGPQSSRPKGDKKKKAKKFSGN